MATGVTGIITFLQQKNNNLNYTICICSGLPKRDMNNIKKKRKLSLRLVDQWFDQKLRKIAED